MPDQHPHIIGIDLSMTRTGVCVIDGLNGDIDVFSVKSQPDNGTVRGLFERAKDIATAIEFRAQRANSIDLVVAIESLSFGSKGSGVDRIHYMWWRVQEVLEQFGYPPAIRVSPSQRAKYATGKGNAGKDEVLASAIRRYPDVPISNNDEADATVIAAIAARAFGNPLEDGEPTRTMLEVVAAVTA